MKTGIATILGLVTIFACQTCVKAEEPKAGTAKATTSGSDVLAELYEHLANSIIEIRATEDHLVKGMLVHYHIAAQRHLAEAAAKSGERVKHFEAAAGEIANIANEGDKRAQAVRQRLSNAGHYHQKDSQTQEDYMFINSTEKKSLLALAKKVGQLGANTEAGDIKKASEELTAQFAKSIGRE